MQDPLGKLLMQIPSFCISLNQYSQECWIPSTSHSFISQQCGSIRDRYVCNHYRLVGIGLRVIFLTDPYTSSFAPCIYPLFLAPHHQRHRGHHCQCVLCKDGSKDIHRLFCQCPYSAYIWTLCKLKLAMQPGVHSLEQESIQLQNRFNKKTKVYILARLMLSSAVRHLWLERYRKVFQGEELNNVCLFRRLYEDAHMLLQTCHWKV